MLVVAIVGILSALAGPSYRSVIERQKIGQAAIQLMKMSLLISHARNGAGLLPVSLAALPGIPAADPWGNPYRYLRLAPLDPAHRNEVRKDHNLHPINSEFDLYSTGPDGDTRAPLTASASRDDIIFARDGNFVGTAADF